MSLALACESGYIAGCMKAAGEAQRRALASYRNRLRKQGMARFEVLGLEADRELLRSLARFLASNDPEVTSVRSLVRRAVYGEEPKKGGILEALRRSPMVGADLKANRSIRVGRKIDI